MASSTLIPVEEYLKTVYRPDCDYVDGVVGERNSGELDHGLVQARFAHAFLSVHKRTGLLPYTELRMRVRENKYRVADVVVTVGKPDEQILTKPPLLCIEVLSLKDGVTPMNSRVLEYLNFGVPSVWVADPVDKTVWIYRPDGMEEVSSGSIKLDGTSLEVQLAEIFD